MTKFEIVQIVTGLIGSCGFAVLFNIRGKKMLAGTLGGGLSWLLFVLLKYATESEAIRYFVVAFVISLYAEGMARLLKSPTTTFLMVSLIPLVPGGSLYYTMASAFTRDAALFLSRAAGTLSLTVALALGIVLATALAKLLTNTLAYLKQRRTETL